MFTSLILLYLAGAQVNTNQLQCTLTLLPVCCIKTDTSLLLCSLGVF